MNKGYQSFIEQTESTLSRKGGFPGPYFSTYAFSSDFGRGYTSIYEIDSYASICISEHVYTKDFKYSVQSDESIAMQQYDSIASDRSYPSGNVYTGMQYIGYHKDNEVYEYVIKKDIPAKVICIVLMPEYYEGYLKKELDAKDMNLKEELQAFPHGFSIPEISFLLNQIRNFKGSEVSARLFFKSKIDEMAALIIQKAEELRTLSSSITAADKHAIIEVMAYLKDNLSKNPSLSALASSSYMSVSKFKYAFKAVAGQTASEYITQKKMERACELLTYSNLYIAEIADLIGYKNAGSFSIQFKKHLGVLPYDYRTSRIK